MVDTETREHEERTHAEDAPAKLKHSPLVLGEVSGKRRWGRFGLRLLTVLLRPAKFWRDLKDDDELAFGELMWPHVLLLIGLRALAGAVGSLLGGGSIGAAAAAFGSSLVSWLALVWVFALVVGSLATARGARLSARDPLRFAAYGLAPLFVVGMLAAVPLPYVAPIAELLAMPYTFHVMALGVIPLLGVKPERSPAVVGLACGFLLVLWGVMPTLVPLVIEALTR